MLAVLVITVFSCVAGYPFEISADVADNDSNLKRFELSLVTFLQRLSEHDDSWISATSDVDTHEFRGRDLHQYSTDDRNNVTRAAEKRLRQSSHHLPHAAIGKSTLHKCARCSAL